MKEEDEQHFNIEEVDEKDLPLVSVIMPGVQCGKNISGFSEIYIDSKNTKR